MNLLMELFTFLEVMITDEGLKQLGAGIGAGIAVFTGFGSGIGQGLSADLVHKQLVVNQKRLVQFSSTMIVGQAVAETAGIYGLIVAILLIFVF